MGLIRIAARVASYTYCDGVNDPADTNKSIEELYKKFSQGRHKIDLSKIATAGQPDPSNPDSKRRL